jgi:hypothetical protein
VSAARRTFDVQRERFRKLINSSNSRLEPLRDPLLTDFGVNRWLSNRREEAWSDWLEWVITQLKTSEAVCELFGIELPQPTWGIPEIRLSTQREVSVLQGHRDRKGRLDIIIRFSPAVVIVVEVKVTNADKSDVKKNKGYKAWLNDQPEREKIPILLATDGTSEEYEGFDLVRWSEISGRLRKLVMNGQFDDLVVRSLICGFIGAIEQRLLGFRSESVLGILDGRLGTFDTRVIDYIEETLGKGE